MSVGGIGATEEVAEGYFASISDLMVGILFIFLLMLTFFALNYQEAGEQQVVALERYRQLQVEAEAARRRAEEQETEARRLAELARERQAEAVALRVRNERLQIALDAAVARLQQEIRERENARADLLVRLSEGLAARGVSFRIDHQSGVLRLSEDVPFAVGRADLTDRTRRTVQVLAELLVKVLPCFAKGGTPVDCGGPRAAILETVLIEGHTDQQGFAGMTPQQSVLENDRLSAARALSVFAELRRLQPDLEALRSAEDVPLLGVSGYGERRPVASEGSDVAFAQNRRIDLRFVLSSRTSEEVRRLIEEIDRLRQVPT